jgi:5S rRNA maturation endonuclease (ribonuclease M5)
MFPIKRIEKIHQELNHYYLQVIAFQDKDSQYQDIVAKFSKNLSELEDIIEDMRKYNNKNNPLININKEINK